MREPKPSDSIRASKLVGMGTDEKGRPILSFSGIGAALAAISIERINGNQIKKPVNEAELYALMDAFETPDLWSEFVMKVMPAELETEEKVTSEQRTAAAESLKKRPKTQA